VVGLLGIRFMVWSELRMGLYFGSVLAFLLVGCVEMLSMFFNNDSFGAFCPEAALRIVDS